MKAWWRFMQLLDMRSKNASIWGRRSARISPGAEGEDAVLIKGKPAITRITRMQEFFIRVIRVIRRPFSVSHRPGSCPGNNPAQRLVGSQRWRMHALTYVFAAGSAALAPFRAHLRLFG